MLFRMGLSALWYSGIARALEPLTRGIGTILVLHRVQPRPLQTGFSPNATLAITPEYLDALLTRLGRDRMDFVDLDEALRRLADPAGKRPFVCFTADDGYRDNFDHAWPIFRRHGTPLTIFVTTGFIDGSVPIWWRVVESVVANRDVVRVRGNGGELVLPAGDLGAKHEAYAQLVASFFGMTVPETRATIAALAEDNDCDPLSVCAGELCTWDMLRAMKKSGGVDIGCHTVNHPVLANESVDVVRAEMVDARATLEHELGEEVRHFAYPYGAAEHAGPREFALARDVGFASATTARKGSLHREHVDHLYALPRVDMSPEFAGSPHYLRTTLSGLPLLAWNRGRRVVSG